METDTNSLQENNTDNINVEELAINKNVKFEYSTDAESLENLQINTDTINKQPVQQKIESRAYRTYSSVNSPLSRSSYYPTQEIKFPEHPNENTYEPSEKGWTRSNIRVVKYYVNFLSYMCLIYHFYFFKLKQIEGYWSWAIIVFSSLSSALSLFQYHDEKYYLELSVKITITVFTLIITLISAWVKKQNYVERISELGKYSIKLNKLKNTVKSVIEEPINNRIDYIEFTKLYKKDIIEFISNRPLISPYEWKETVFIISKYYPELAAYEFPWNKVENYGFHAMETYKRLKYNSFWKKIKHCYYCKSRCMCRESLESRELAKEIMDENIKFYQNLPKYDLDYNPYHTNQDDKIKPRSRSRGASNRSKYVYSDSEFEFEPPDRNFREQTI